MTDMRQRCEPHDQRVTSPRCRTRFMQQNGGSARRVCDIGGLSHEAYAAKLQFRTVDVRQAVLPHSRCAVISACAERHCDNGSLNAPCLLLAFLLVRGPGLSNKEPLSGRSRLACPLHAVRGITREAYKLLFQSNDAYMRLRANDAYLLLNGFSDAYVRHTD